MSVKEFPAQKEYEKVQSLKPEDIKEIREWLKTQTHLPHTHLTGEYFVRDHYFNYAECKLCYTLSV